MEIPVLSRISCFEAEITRFQNPSFVSRFFHLSAIAETIKIQTFWTWGALIFALLATLTSFLTRFKLVIFRLYKGKSVISQPLHQKFYSDEESEDEYDEDETCSSSSEASYSSDEEDDSVFEKYDEDFRVAGQGQNRKFKYINNESSFSWSDFVAGKSVVKSWDGFGLGLGLEKASESIISLWDLNKPERSVSSSSGGKYQVPAITMPSPAVIMSAGLETGRNAALRVFDTRVGRQIPQLLTEWQPCRNVGSVFVRDIRKIASPIENLTESDLKTQWDSDAVIVDGNRQICCLKNDCGSVVSRCHEVLSYLF